MRRSVLCAAGVVAAAAGMLACQENLTSPGQCPELCPGGTPVVFDTVLSAVQGGDESVPGYVSPGQGSALLVSNGLPSTEARAVYRYVARFDSIAVRDTARAYTIDSVMLVLNLVARDTLVNGLKVYLYRLPPEFDPTVATFDGVEPLLNDAALLDSIAVPDSVNSGPIFAMFRGVDTSKVSIPLGTGGVLAIGVKIAAESPTGIRLGSLAFSTGATFNSFVTLDVPDTTTSIVHQTVARGTQSNSFVTQSPFAAPPATLLVGGEPSSRSFVRFDLPPRIKDSASVVKATLELLPAGPIPGLATDPAILDVLPVLSDLGPKSPLDEQRISQATLPIGGTDTVRVDVTQMVKLWQSASERPQEVALRLRPEAASFTRAVFGSTDPVSPVGSPRLHVTYLLAFPFENP